MRTYRREDWLASQRAWDDGEFGYRWQAIRRIAADRGFIYPPSGTIHDDREVEFPSQRAIVWRALEDNPREVERIVRRAWSWFDVVDNIIGLEARLRVDADEDGKVDDWEREQLPDHRESVMALSSILKRIGDSA
jgi:hypothetical protein